MMDTLTTHTRYESKELYRIYTDSEAEGDYQWDTELGCEASCYISLETVREIYDVYEPMSVLGNQRPEGSWPEDIMGESELFSERQDYEGTTCCDSGFGDCRVCELFI